MRRRLDAKTMEKRDKEIMRLLEKGLTFDQIAPQVGMTTAGLSSAVSRHRKKEMEVPDVG